MATEVVIVQGERGRTEAVKQAIQVINRGGVVAFPTETVYGLGVRADDVAAVERLRSIKGRLAEKALTVHIGDRDEVEKFVPHLSGAGRRLIRKGWPGPLTLVFPVADANEAAARGGFNGAATRAMYYDGTIGLRCPDDIVANGILRGANGPVVASSVNAAGEPPALVGAEVVKRIPNGIDLVIDAGRTQFAKPSTVVRLTDRGVEVLREGVLDARMVEQMATLRLLFVCTGNTCRSPMAAGLARKLIADRLGCSMADLAGRGVVVESAGTSGGHGRAAAHAVSVLGRRGIDLTDHQSSALRVETIQQADHVWVMTRGHRDAVLNMAPGAKERVQLLLADQDVVDPIGGSMEDYETCAERIAAGLEVRLREVCP